MQSKLNKCGIPVIRDEEHLIGHSCKAKKGGFGGPGIVPYELQVTNPGQQIFKSGPVTVIHQELQDTDNGFLLDTGGLALLAVP